MTLRRALTKVFYERVVLGEAGRIVGPLYDAVVTAELRIVDSATVPTSERDDVTALIKTFERPAIVRRLIRTIRRRFTKMPILVVDDSRWPKHQDDADVIVLPYNSGVSAGRNAGLDHVQTPFLLLLDDDFVFTNGTDVDRVVDWLEAHPSVDLVGGKVIYLPFFTNQAHPIYKGEDRIDGLRVCDKVPNFYVARTESIKKVRWDSRLKRVDHHDFFARARGVITSVYDPRFSCLHARTLFLREYMDERLDVDADLALLQEKYGVNAPRRTDTQP